MGLRKVSTVTFLSLLKEGARPQRWPRRWPTLGSVVHGAPMRHAGITTSLDPAAGTGSAILKPALPAVARVSGC